MSKLYSQHRNFILYGLIGGICTLVDFLVFYLLQKAGVHYLLDNVISYHCGIICSFFMNRHYNFKIKDKTATRFISFYLISLLGLVVCEMLLWLFVDGFNLNNLLSKLLATILVGIAQFICVKHFTFKKSASNIE
ncbi:MAG: GtrA family protein [Bacteroidales bacterium]|nr:GtrA family protein [Bacteroidales bacterium]